jgi:hypothetical protein
VEDIDKDWLVRASSQSLTAEVSVLPMRMFSFGQTKTGQIKLSCRFEIRPSELQTGNTKNRYPSLCTLNCDEQNRRKAAGEFARTQRLGLSLRSKSAERLFLFRMKVNESNQRWSRFLDEATGGANRPHSTGGKVDLITKWGYRPVRF